jgi:hypothetical protein
MKKNFFQIVSIYDVYVRRNNGKNDVIFLFSRISRVIYMSTVRSNTFVESYCLYCVCLQSDHNGHTRGEQDTGWTPFTSGCPDVDTRDGLRDKSMEVLYEASRPPFS